jgi:uncharacterized membrane protein
MFTDAVAAIAITLLILPLLETVSAESGEKPLGDLIGDHVAQLGAFVLSFAVIFRFWWAHHTLFRHIRTLRMAVVRYSVLWTFGIVLLPIPTAIIAEYSPSPVSVGIYGGTLAITSGALALLALTAYRHPELSGDHTPTPRDSVLGTTTAFATQVVATVIGSIFAAEINYWAFLLMFLTEPVERLIKSRWR